MNEDINKINVKTSSLMMLLIGYQNFSTFVNTRESNTAIEREFITDEQILQILLSIKSRKQNFKVKIETINWNKNSHLIYQQDRLYDVIAYFNKIYDLHDTYLIRIEYYKRDIHEKITDNYLYKIN